MDDFRNNLKLTLAPYKVGAAPRYLKTDGETKQIEGGFGNNEVKASALRDTIRKRTGGKVEVADSINNENSLLGILRSYMRMKNYGNGNLVPDNVTVFDPKPGTVRVLSGGVGGEYWNQGGLKSSRDPIAILDTSWNPGNTPELDTGENRFHPVTGNNVNATSQHELAHAAQFAYDTMPQRYHSRLLEDVNKYKDKYSAGDIIYDSLSKVKYAVPKLFDAMFGTHIVPTYKEWADMTDENAAAFWADNFKSLKDGYSYDTMAEKMAKSASDKTKDFFDSHTGWKHPENPDGLFEQAAKNTGFNSVDEANASISGYAKSDWTEAFAEAYSDVLLNGDKATPYSKELIRLYSEAVDKWAKRFRENEMPMQLSMLKKLMDVSPINGDLSLKKGKK